MIRIVDDAEPSDKFKIFGFGDQKIPWLWKNWRSKIETISESSYIEMPAPEMNKISVGVGNDVRDQFLARTQWYHGVHFVNFSNYLHNLCGALRQ